MKNFNSKKLLLAISFLCSSYLMQAQSVTIQPYGTGVENDNSGDNIIISSSSSFLGIQSYRFNGPATSKTNVLNGNSLLTLGAGGYYSPGSRRLESSLIKFIATENWTPTASGSKITFGTMANGNIFNQERMVIDHNGNVGIGVSPTTSKFQVDANSSNPTATFNNIGSGIGVSSITDAGRAGSFNSSSGIGLEASSGSNIAIMATNGSPTQPVAQLVNLSGGTALNLIGTTAMNITGAIKVSGTPSFRPAFTIVSVAGNIFSNQVIIPNTTLANNSNDILIITHNFGSGLIGNYNKIVGVYWDGGTSSWRIYNEDSSAMPVGVTFNILVIKQ